MLEVRYFCILIALVTFKICRATYSINCLRHHMNDVINGLRISVNSTNMKVACWDDSMQKSADISAKKCELFQGIKSGTSQFYEVGPPGIEPLNLFMNVINHPDATNCKISQKCGHLKQWYYWNVEVFGCQINRCNVMGKSQDVLFCHYKNPWREDEPLFEKGYSCSKCSGACFRKLCMSDKGCLPPEEEVTLLPKEIEQEKKLDKKIDISIGTALLPAKSIVYCLCMFLSGMGYWVYTIN